MTATVSVRKDRVESPFFSVCIPQYNRTSFLLEALKSLDAQTFRDFEVCVSDDCSTDGREEEVLSFLTRSRLSFVYERQPRNLRYDANLRASIGLARGTYCFLLGNDDALADSCSLADLYADICRFGPIGVVTTNFQDFATGTVVRRVRGIGRVGSGPRVAARQYRNFSFVSGVGLDRSRAQAHATDRWDGGEMYQTYVASRIIAEGYPLLTVERSTVRAGIVIPGEVVDSVFSRPRMRPCPIVERELTLTHMGRIVADAIAPYASAGTWQREVEWVLAQLYLFPYVYWLITYRRIQSRRYALGVCLGMRPRNVMEGINLSLARRARLIVLWALVSLAATLVPVRLFDYARRPLHRLAKLVS